MGDVLGWLAVGITGVVIGAIVIGCLFAIACILYVLGSVMLSVF